MNVLKVFGFAAVLLFTTNTYASNDPGKKTDVRNEISATLSKMDLEEENFMINFIVNSKGEIVVISTSSQKSDRLVREVLNYKKVGTEAGVNIHTMYTMPVTIKKK